MPRTAKRSSATAPYLYSRDGQPDSIWSSMSFEQALQIQTTQGGYIKPDLSPDKVVRKPAKPRKPSSRVFLDSLPLTTSPVTASAPVVPVVGVASVPQETCQTQTVCVMPSQSRQIESGAGPAPARPLTPSQLRALEQAERFGILTEDGCETLRAWRLAISRAELSKRPVSFISRLRKLLSPSIGKESV